jgi:hypothetical protein
MSFGRILGEILDRHAATPYMARPGGNGRGGRRDRSGIYKAIAGKILRPQPATLLDWMAGIDASHAEEVIAVSARLMATVEEEVCEAALYLLFALSPANNRAGLLEEAAQRAGIALDEIRDRMPEAQRRRVGDPAMQVYIAAARGAYERPPTRRWQDDSAEAWRYEQEFAGRLHAMRDALARLLIQRVSWEGASHAFVVEWTATATALLQRAGAGTEEGPSYRLDSEGLRFRLAPPPPGAPSQPEPPKSAESAHLHSYRVPPFPPQ